MVSQANGPWLSKLPTTRRWEATEVSDGQIWIDWLQLAISLVMLIIRRWWKGLFISSTSPPSLPICLCCKSTFDQGSVARAINRNWHDRPPVAQTNFLAAFLFQHLLVRLLLLCSNSNCSFLRFNDEETVTEVSIQLPYSFTYFTLNLKSFLNFTLLSNWNQEVRGRLLLPKRSPWSRGEEGGGFPTRWVSLGSWFYIGLEQWKMGGLLSTSWFFFGNLMIVQGVGKTTWTTGVSQAGKKSWNQSLPIQGHLW